MAATHAAKEAIYLQRFFEEIGFLLEGPMTIFSDNQSCISLLRNPTFHARTKHVEIHHHFVRKKIEEGKINLVFLRNLGYVTDNLTKGLTCRDPPLSPLLILTSLRMYQWLASLPGGVHDDD